LIGKYWFERFARLPVEIDIASEFRYREAPFRPGNLALFVSQSGETADTLATLRYAREQKQHVVSIVNVATSTIARESDAVMPTLAGPEIGVASTKAFTCQLTVLACLAIAAGRARGVLDEEDETNLVCHITHTTSRDLSRKTRQPSEDAYRKSIVSPCSPIIRLEPCEKPRGRTGAPMCRRNARCARRAGRYEP
jgi:glucosamine 6-phosphate synthetase-like amidotransferase/phosphosugar isomerase protein